MSVALVAADGGRTVDRRKLTVSCRWSTRYWSVTTTSTGAADASTSSASSLNEDEIDCRGLHPSLAGEEAFRVDEHFGRNAAHGRDSSRRGATANPQLRQEGEAGMRQYRPDFAMTPMAPCRGADTSDGWADTPSLESPRC